MINKDEWFAGAKMVFRKITHSLNFLSALHRGSYTSGRFLLNL